MQPVIRFGDLLPESIGEKFENIFVVEWLAVQSMARTRSGSTEAA